MPSPELLATELRLARPAAPPALRERVLAVAAAAEPAPARPRPRLRRAFLVAVPVAASLAVAAGLVRGLVSETPRERATPVADTAAPAQTTLKAGAESRAAGPPASLPPASLPAAGGRAQAYEAALTLGVRDVSGATKSALRTTRSLGGYVRTADLAGRRADLVVRVPIGRVQEAIVSFSGLGSLLAQHVSIRDVQGALDRRTVQMRELRRRIAELRSRGDAEGAARLSRALAALERAQAEELRRTRFATVALSLERREAEAAPAGRIDRALDGARGILAREFEILLYAVVAAGPPLALLLVALAAVRMRRRRADERLLERASPAR